MSTYLDESHLTHQSEVERLGSDFGLVYHSTSIQDDPNLKYLTDWIGQTAQKVMTEWEMRFIKSHFDI